MGGQYRPHPDRRHALPARAERDDQPVGRSRLRRDGTIRRDRVRPVRLREVHRQSSAASGLELDACRCWNESFQDFSIAGRYRFGDEFWALTPQVRYILPSHDYPYQGEAVVGPNLQQLLLGISGAWRLAPVLPKASIQAGYTFALVETVETSGRTEAT